MAVVNYFDHRDSVGEKVGCKDTNKHGELVDMRHCGIHGVGLRLQ